MLRCIHRIMDMYHESAFQSHASWSVKYFTTILPSHCHRSSAHSHVGWLTRRDRSLRERTAHLHRSRYLDGHITISIHNCIARFLRHSKLNNAHHIHQIPSHIFCISMYEQVSSCDWLSRHDYFISSIRVPDMHMQWTHVVNHSLFLISNEISSDCTYCL